MILIIMVMINQDYNGEIVTIMIVIIRTSTVKIVVRLNYNYDISRRMNSLVFVCISFAHNPFNLPTDSFRPSSHAHSHSNPNAESHNPSSL